VVGDSHTVTRFKTWGAKALAGIGHVADTLLDRAIILELRRKLSHEEVDRIRHAKPELFEDLKAKLARFADDYRDKVRHARPPLPDSLNDRAQDNWEPLLAIAMVAGGDWLQIGTAAALKISGSEEITQTTGTELLSNIREIFDEKQIDRISTTELIKALCADEEWSWLTYNRGLPIKPRQLANRLKAYNIHSKNIRIGYGTPKGFTLDQFSEAFSRYTSTGGDLSATVQQNININNDIACSGVAFSEIDSATISHNATEYSFDEEIERLLPYP
jgi:putative DNA primase/helicase